MVIIDKLHLTGMVLLLAACAALFIVYRQWHADVEKAKAVQKSSEVAMAEREKQFQEQKGQLEQLRVTSKTPHARVVGNLSQLLGFPVVETTSVPVSGQLATAQKEGGTVGTGIIPHPPLPDSPTANIVLSPTQQVDLTNRLVTCNECIVENAKLKKDVLSVTLERDAWIKAAKGGSFWQRFKRQAKAFGLGAVAGAVIVEGARAATGHP
jgi:hypothetical protein